VKSQVKDYIPSISSPLILFKQEVAGSRQELQDDPNIEKSCHWMKRPTLERRYAE
jgi:hypothetical protein